MKFTVLLLSAKCWSLGPVVSEVKCSGRSLQTAPAG